MSKVLLSQTSDPNKKLLKNFTLKKMIQKPNHKIHPKSSWMAVLFVLLSHSFVAQVQNSGTLFIADGGGLYLSTGNFSFGASPAKTTTSRTANVYGKLVFSSTATANGGTVDHAVDGYIMAIGENFLFPTSHGPVFAPAGIQQATANTTVAYLDSSNAATTYDSSLSAIAASGRWDIKGDKGKITLTWSADISTIASSLEHLTIAGLVGTEWVQIPSVIDSSTLFADASSLISGDITSDYLVDLTAYAAFTLASKEGACAPLLASSGIIKTWNGSWSPSEPNLLDPVIIDAPYSGSLACNSLVLNANITLTGTQSVEIINGVTTNTANKIIMSSESSVVQRSNTSLKPLISLTKTTPLKKKYDYVYWGTPIQENFFNAIATAQANGGSGSAFDLKFRYQSGIGGGWVELTSNDFATGKGYITRVANQAPFLNDGTASINMPFEGTANNGDITVAVTNNPNNLNGGTSHNLLANPYPSAIDANKFLEENESLIDGVVYIWTSTSAFDPSAYAQSDYIVYNKSGSVIPNGITEDFDGNIASGQGFKVKVKPSGTVGVSNTGNVTFTNCMRLLGDNTSFYKQPNQTMDQSTSSKNSFKLNMTGSDGVFSQILITYLPTATMEYDFGYDAGRNSVSTAQLYSIFEGDGRKLAINARPSFVDTDVVPLGISKNNTTTEEFSIAITNKEGIFSTDEAIVYLYDNQTNTYHDLATGSYDFSTSTTSLEDRFQIVYQSEALDNPDFDHYITSAQIKDKIFTAKATIGMQKIEVYDMMGRLIQVYEGEGSESVAQPFNHAQGVYIAKILLENDGIATQKLINN